MRRKELRRFLDRHLHYVANRFIVIENFERLRIVTATAAIFAGHITAREKIHYQLDHALTSARLAAAAFGVKREPARRIPANTRDRQLRVKIADFVKYFDVCARRRTRRFPNGRLIDLVDRLGFRRAADELE